MFSSHSHVVLKITLTRLKIMTIKLVTSIAVSELILRVPYHYLLKASLLNDDKHIREAPGILLAIGKVIGKGKVKYSF